MGTSTKINSQTIADDLKRTCLQEATLFAGLTETQLDAIGQLCRAVAYDVDDVIVAEGSVGTELFITVDGRVRVEIRLPREETSTTIYQVGKHEVFGEFALLDDYHRSATLVANSAMIALVVSREDLFALMEADPPIGFIIMRNLSNILATKLRNVNHDLRGLLANQKRLFNLVV